MDQFAANHGAGGRPRAWRHAPGGGLHGAGLAGGGMLEPLEPRCLLSLSPVGAAGSDSAVASLYAGPALVAQPTFRRFQPAGGVLPAGSTAPTGLTPSQIRQAYGINLVTFSGGTIQGDGTGQTIALIDAYDTPTMESDLAAFSQAFGLPLLNQSGGPTFRRVAQDGSTNYPTVDPAGAGNPAGNWETETALDVEWAHAIAPGANLLLVEARSPNYSDLMPAVTFARAQPGVVVVSMSFGSAEFSGQTVYDSNFTTPSGHTGVTFVASTGDAGKPGGFPAYSPNVLAVGGTALAVDGAGNYLSESGWSGSGGGISQLESQPSYQNGVVTQSSTKRTIPDVAFDADPNSGAAVYDSYNNGTSSPWEKIGGTSFSAPAWAGLIAIADQGRVLSGLAALDGPTGTLPALYGLPAGDFHDIVSGNNGFAAGTGYDLVTGRGTPYANLVVADLVGGTVNQPPAIASLSASPNPVTSGQTLTLTANGVTDPDGTVASVTFYRESNGAAGLQVGAGGDTAYTPVTNGTNGWSVGVSTSGLAAGTYTFYAQATDNSGGRSPAGTSAPSASVVVSSNAPANDNFANRIVLPGIWTTITGSNVNATHESSDPRITSNRGGASVWWSWTAPATGNVAISTAGSSFNTLLGVYTGSSLSSLTLVASNNDEVSGSILTSKVTFAVVAGTTYQIDVDGNNNTRNFANAAEGSITLSLLLPDLVPYAPAGWPAPLVVSTAPGVYTEATTVAANQTLYFSYGLDNNGTLAAPASAAQLYLDGQLLLTSAVPALAPGPGAGAAFQVADTPQAPLHAGAHTVQVRLDPAGSVFESDKTNNVFSYTFTVVPYVTTSTWVQGAGNGNWSDPNQWSPVGVPNNTADHLFNVQFDQAGDVAVLDQAGATVVASLTLAAGATLRVAPVAGPAVLVTGRLSVAGNPGAWAGTLDMGASDLIVDPGPGAGDPSGLLATIGSEITAGAAGGPPANPGIASSPALVDHSMALGWMSNDAGDGVTPIHATFDGQPVSAGAVLVRYTYVGDANLDGAVNLGDLSVLVQHFGQAGDWSAGDMNFDGQVDLLDLASLARNYGRSLPVTPTLAPAAVTPSPGAAAPVPVAAVPAAPAPPPAPAKPKVNSTALPAHAARSAPITPALPPPAPVDILRLAPRPSDDPPPWVPVWSPGDDALEWPSPVLDAPARDAAGHLARSMARHHARFA